MKKALKIFLLLLVCTVIAACVSLAVICSSTKAMQRFVTFAANKVLASEGIEIQDFTIRRQKCALPGEISFENVSFALRQGKDVFYLSFESVVLSGLLSSTESALQLQGGEVKSEAFSLHGLEVSLVSKNKGDLTGPGSASLVQSSGFEVTDIKSRVTIRTDRVLIEGIDGDSYKGKMTGTATFYFIPEPHYIADVSFDGLDTVKMESINPSLFSQVRGQIYGTIEVIGPAGGLEKIHMNVLLKDGSEIQAKALGPLLAYIPKSLERKDLETAIEQNNLIIVTNAQLKLGNEDSGKVSAEIRLKSDNLNLDVNVTADIIINGGLQSILKYFAQITEFMKGE